MKQKQPTQAEIEKQQQLRKEKELEQQALNIMLDKGLPFSTPVRSFLKYFRKDKKRHWRMHKPYLDTMDRLADEKLKLQISEDQYKGNVIYEKNVIIKDNVKIMAKIVAISWLNNRHKIKYLSGIFTKYFMSRLDSQKLKDIVTIIELLENAGPFINSIISTSGSQRTTQPKADLIEENHTA